MWAKQVGKCKQIHMRQGWYAWNIQKLKIFSYIIRFLMINLRVHKG